MVSVRTSIGAPGESAGSAFQELIDNGPTPAYAKAFAEAGELLEELAGMAAQYLKRHGYAAHAQSGRDRGNPEGLTPGLADEEVAALAGLGWIGKNTLLTTRRYGSALRLASVYTDAPLPYGSPVTFSSCGSCSDCAENCPAGALTDTPWRDGMQRDEQLDLKACQKHALTLSKKKLGKSVLLCGRCMAVCPYVTRL